ncbi:hypothetical protein EGW08_023862, partial [Elysia chlorotica]
MKGMYRRRGNQSGGNEWMCTHCGLTFDNASLLNLHTLTHAAEDIGMEEIRRLAAKPSEGGVEVSASLPAVPPSSSPSVSGEASLEATSLPAAGVCVSAQSEARSSADMMVACPKCNMVFNDHKELMGHVSTHAQK